LFVGEARICPPLFIEWDPPLIPNGIITLYTIYAAYENGSDILIVNSSERIYILEGLSPHQLVLISMSASTIVGEGPVSHAIAERTSQAGKNNTCSNTDA